MNRERWAWTGMVVVFSVTGCATQASDAPRIEISQLDDGVVASSYSGDRTQDSALLEGTLEEQAGCIVFVTENSTVLPVFHDSLDLQKVWDSARDGQKLHLTGGESNSSVKECANIPLFLVGEVEAAV